MTETAAPIDRATFAELQATAGAEFVGELVDTFLAEAPAMFAELRAAHAAQSAERFRRAAHSLKSNAHTFGALKLGAMAKALELGGFAFAKAGAPVAEAADEYGRAAAELEELARG